jgi:probable addiction module antidote protein
MRKKSTKSRVKTNTLPYDVTEQLRTPEEMAAYLDAWLVEAPDDVGGIARALGDIARAKAMSRVARAAGLSRGCKSARASLTCRSDIVSLRFRYRRDRARLVSRRSMELQCHHRQLLAEIRRRGDKLRTHGR